VRQAKTYLLLSLFLGAITTARASSSLLGPWRRYQSPELGIELMVADNWPMSHIPNGLVFAMQSKPDPYVRVAIGKIQSTEELIRHVVAQRQQSGARVVQSHCRVGGYPAIQLDSQGPQGGYRDVFVSQGPNTFWIGFAADNPELWPTYSATFEIVLSGIRFI
jgi:hypothetical protein